MNIAIIGAGLSGSNILKNLFDNNLIEQNQIYIFEPREKLGSGFPYEFESEYKLLNVPERFMSMDDDDMGFVKWLEANKTTYQNFEGMTPRNYYGQYLEDFYRPYYNHPNINIVKKEVTDMEVVESFPKTYRLKTDQWEEPIFDAVFLTLGHPDYSDHYDLRDKKNYIHNPYPLEKMLAHLTKDDKIAMIGAGATSLDVFRYILQSYELENPFYILTRDSIFNIPHIELDKSEFRFSINDEWVQTQLDENGGIIPLDNILHLVAEDFKSEGVAFHKCYERIKNNSLELYRELLEEKPQDIALIVEYFEHFTKYFSKLYGLLSKSDQNFYMDKYHDKIDAFRALTPPNTATWLLDTIDAGKALIIKGLEEIKVNDSGQFEAIADENITVDYLINTTGFDFNIERNAKRNTLIKNLYDKKIIDSDEEGNSVNITWPKATVLSKRYGELENLYMIGMWVFSIHYRANDIRSVKEVAKVVVENFTQKRSYTLRTGPQST